MRILQISSAKEFGGGERHVSDLCRSLAAKGHEVDLVLRPSSPLLEEVAHLSNVTCHTLSLRGALDMVSVYRLSQIIEQTGSEIVHAHYARDYPLSALAVRYSRAARNSLPAFFITRHHYLPLKGNRLYRRLLGALDCAIAVSESVRQTLSRSFGWSDDPHSPRLLVIPNWIDLPKFSLSDSARGKYRLEFGIKAEGVAVGLINQIGEAKGQATLLRAVARLGSSHKDLQVVLAGREHGPDQSYTRYLGTLAKELGIADRVIFTGYVTRTAELLAALDLVAIPSENEAFSIVCLEAMAARRPVIASAVGGLAEIIEPEKTGLLFPAGDSEALAAQIARAIDSPALCARLTEAAYLSVKERFSREVQIARIEELYMEAIKKRG